MVPKFIRNICVLQRIVHMKEISFCSLYLPEYTKSFRPKPPSALYKFHIKLVGKQRNKVFKYVCAIVDHHNSWIHVISTLFLLAFLHQVFNVFQGNGQTMIVKKYLYKL